MTKKKPTKKRSSEGRPRPRTQAEVPGTESSRSADRQIDKLAVTYLEAADEHGEISARVKDAKANLVGALVAKKIDHYVCKDGTKIDVRGQTKIKVTRPKSGDEDEAA